MNEPVRHLGMVLDGARVAAYRRALDAAIDEGATVADVGAGSGLLSVLACRAGAGRVFAIEPSPVIGLARELVAANGCGDRVTFLRADAAGVELPGPIDLVVSDLRGTLPLRLPQLRALAGFTRRWLAPGGTSVPGRDTLWAAPCRNRRAIHRRAIQHSSAGEALADVDLSPLVASVTHTWWRQDLAAEDLAGEPRSWGEVVFGEEPGRLRAELSWDFAEATVIDGLAAWFSADLGFGAAFDSAPGAGPETCYGQAFFPWPRRLEVAAGDVLGVTLRADPTGEHFTWSWRCDLRRAGASVASLDQSTFQAAALGLLPSGGGAGGS